MKMKTLLSSLATLALVSLVSLSAVAQDYPANRIVLKVRPNAKAVRFSIRVGETVPAVNVYYNDGSITPTSVPNSLFGGTDVQTVDYTFTTPSASEREIAIDAEELITLRISGGTTDALGINGFKEIIAPKLVNLQAANLFLEEQELLDLSKAPELVNLDLSFTGIRKVELPKNSKLEKIAISPRFNMPPTTGLEYINLGEALALKTLSIPESRLDTIDLRRNVNIVELNVSNGYAYVGSTRVRVRAILGIKDLNLTSFTGHSNNLGFDQLPNLVGQAVNGPQDYVQTTYYLNPSKINNNVVDLKHLKTAKGINTAEKETTFVWQMARVKQGADGKYVYDLLAPNNTYQFDAIPEDKYTVNSLGEYTFDPSIMVVDGKDGTKVRRIRFQMSNAEAYPSIRKAGTTYYNNLIAQSIEVVDPATTSSIEVFNSASPAVVGVAGGVQFTSEATGLAQIFALDGKIIYQGEATGTVSLPSGIYIVRTGKTATKVAIK